MDYHKCVQTLFASEEMANIPDSWKMEAPILFRDAGKRKIGYLFTQCINGRATVKLMLSVSTDDGKVTKYTTDKLKDDFQANIETLDAICIKDYDVYFQKKEEQEAIIGDVLDGNEISWEHLMELTKELFSPQQYEEIVLRIGKDFYKQ